MRAALLVVCVVGCLHSDSVVCESVTCAQGRVCAPDGKSCVSQEQLDACAGKADEAGCGYSGVPAGVCSGQVCIPAGCGNGIVEPSLGEVCDDGNRVSFDGCNGECTSDERCGNGFTDTVLGEDCDCGDGTGVAPAGCVMANSDAPGATCRSDCSAARCGDAIVDPFELCDDGNTLPGDGCRADCAGRWTPMVSNTVNTITAAWARSATDVFAVGSSGLLLHFDGSHWTKFAPVDPTSVYLAVTGTATDAYAVFAQNGVVNTYIDHYNGSSWAREQVLTGGAITDNLTAATAFGNEVYIMGNPGNGGISTHLYKRATSSGAWTALPAFGARCTALWGSSPSDLYAVADGITTYHFTGGATWSQVTSESGSSVWGSGPNDVYIFDANTPMTLHHYTGTWSDVAYVFDEAPGELKVFGTAANDVFLAGGNGWMYHFDGASWAPMVSGTTRLLHWIAAYAPGRGFVVGDTGTILY